MKRLPECRFKIINGLIATDFILHVKRILLIMRTVRIIKDESFFAGQKSDLAEKGLKIGDIIQVENFVNNAVMYQKNEDTEPVFIYTWNIENV
jgi:hypothetical protein